MEIIICVVTVSHFCSCLPTQAPPEAAALLVPVASVASVPSVKVESVASVPSPSKKALDSAQKRRVDCAETKLAKMEMEMADLRKTLAASQKVDALTVADRVLEPAPKKRQRKQGVGARKKAARKSPPRKSPAKQPKRTVSPKNKKKPTRTSIVRRAGALSRLCGSILTPASLFFSHCSSRFLTSRLLTVKKVRF